MKYVKATILSAFALLLIATGYLAMRDRPRGRQRIACPPVPIEQFCVPEPPAYVWYVTGSDPKHDAVPLAANDAAAACDLLIHLLSVEGVDNWYEDFVEHPFAPTAYIFYGTDAGQRMLVRVSIYDSSPPAVEIHLPPARDGEKDRPVRQFFADGRVSNWIAEFVRVAKSRRQRGQ